MKPPRALQDKWREVLRRDGFRDIEAPSGIIARRPIDSSRSEYLDEARAFLWDHPWESPEHRAIWELHADGRTDRAIARTLLGSETGYARRRIGSVIRRYQGLMLGRARSRRGRPRVEGGRGRGCLMLTVRLPDQAAEALYYLAEELSRRTSRVFGLRDVVRLAVLAQARSISELRK